jgi:hypothetical protein
MASFSGQPPRADLRRLSFIPLIVVDEVGYISSTSAA